MRKFLKILMWIVLALLIVIAAFAAWNWDNIQRHFLGGVKVYETTPPALPADITRPAILVFSKTSGYRHDDSIKEARALFAQMAATKGWGIFQTENGATFSPAILSRFDAVVFNNVSGDVFTPDQRAAFKAFIENGGGFVGVHASGGDFSYDWKWYVNDLIGAQFKGHPMNPQFQDARVVIEDKDHPATKGLPPELMRKDEWYGFEASPRSKPGYRILATLDEASYPNKAMKIAFIDRDTGMGKDHPIVWSHCVGKGRAFYSAMGHLKESYAEPAYRTMLAGATSWALKLEGEGCSANKPEAAAK